MIFYKKFGKLLNLFLKNKSQIILEKKLKDDSIFYFKLFHFVTISSLIVLFIPEESLSSSVPSRPSKLEKCQNIFNQTKESELKIKILDLKNNRPIWSPLANWLSSSFQVSVKK